MEELDPEEQFLRDARNGNLAGIQRLLMSQIKEEAKFNINCKGIVFHYIFIVLCPYCLVYCIRL